jgi:hypothetical protein
MRDSDMRGLRISFRASSMFGVAVVHIEVRKIDPVSSVVTSSIGCSMKRGSGSEASLSSRGRLDELISPAIYSVARCQ